MVQRQLPKTATRLLVCLRSWWGTGSVDLKVLVLGYALWNAGLILPLRVMEGFGDALNG